MENCFAQEIQGKPYFGQESPGATPKVFAPGFISLTDQHEFGSIFSKNGTEFYFGVDRNGKSETLYTQLKEGSWTEPELLLSHAKYGYNDPMLNPDEQELYFISDRPINGNGGKKDIDIWYVRKEGSGWSEPINPGNSINTTSNEYYISFTASGRMYFASNNRASRDRNYDFDIYYSDRIDTEYQEPVKLPPSINSEHYEADVFVAPDESYLIFCANRPDGLGRGDLYISFQNGNSWSEAKNMGSPVNDGLHQLCPFVSADGKYLFYTSNGDIYWVEANIIENYR